MFERKSLYSIRKLSIGVVSVAIATLLMGAGGVSANAQDLEEWVSSDVTEVVSERDTSDLTYDFNEEDLMFNGEGTLLNTEGSSENGDSTDSGDSNPEKPSKKELLGTIFGDSSLPDEVKDSDAYRELLEEYRHEIENGSFSGAHFLGLHKSKDRLVEQAGANNGVKPKPSPWSLPDEPLKRWEYKYHTDDADFDKPYGRSAVTIALPYDDNYTGYASAVQIGANTYLTAAHLFLDHQTKQLMNFKDNKVYVIHGRTGSYRLWEEGGDILKEEINKGTSTAVNVKVSPLPNESGLHFIKFNGYTAVSPSDLAIITVARPIELTYGEKQIPRLIGEDKEMEIGDALTWTGYPTYSEDSNGNLSHYYGGTIGRRRSVTQNISYKWDYYNTMYYTYSKSNGGASGAGAYDKDGKVRAILNGSQHIQLYFPGRYQDSVTLYNPIIGEAHKWVSGILETHDHVNEWYEENGKRYYFDNERKLVRGVEKEIDGKVELFNNKGEWVRTVRDNKPLAPVIRTEDVEIDFEVIERDDLKIKVGETRIEQDGVKGIKRITYTDGRQTKEEVIKEAKPKIVLIGRGVETKEIVEIEFNILEHLDSTLKEGEVEILTKGRNGRKEITKFNGVVTNERVIERAKDEVRRVGTGIETKEIVEIDFKTVEQQDNTLKQGETRIIFEGRKGRKEVTKLNGVITSERVIETPKDRIVKVGSGVETKEIVEIAFEIEERNDNTLKQGERIVEKRGVKGQKEITRFNGIVTNERVIKPAEKEVVRVGTGIEAKEIVEIEFLVVEQNDINLKQGERKVVQQGRKGRKEVTTFNGLFVSERVLERPVDEIVKVGTGIETKEIVEIDFEVVEEFDSSLKQGERKVVTTGRKGRKEVTKFNGVFVSETVIEQPVNERVKVGSGVETKEIVEIDFKVIEQNDPTMLEGTRKVETQGRKGQKEITKFNGTITGERVLVNAVDEVVKVGIGVPTVEVVPIPYKVIEQEDNSLVAGERKVITKGSDGSKEISTFNGEVINERVVNNPVDEVVKVGTGILTKEIVEIEYKVIEQPDDTILTGVRKTEVEGRKGRKEITKLNGVITGEVILEPAQDEIIKVGTGVENVTILEIDFEVKEIKDINLRVGERKVEVQGRKGRKERKTFGDSTATETILEQPVTEIVKVGVGIEVTETVVVPFNVIEERDNTLPLGERKVVVKGVDGSKTVTTFNGDFVKEVVDIEPIDEVVKVGTLVVNDDDDKLVGSSGDKEPVVVQPTEKEPVVDGSNGSDNGLNGGSAGGNNAGEQPKGEQPNGEQPNGEQPNGEQPDGEQPNGEQPIEKPKDEEPIGNGSDKNQNEGSDKPVGNEPTDNGSDNSEGEKPNENGSEGISEPAGDNPVDEEPNEEPAGEPTEEPAPSENNGYDENEPAETDNKPVETDNEPAGTDNELTDTDSELPDNEVSTSETDNEPVVTDSELPENDNKPAGTEVEPDGTGSELTAPETEIEGIENNGSEEPSAPTPIVENNGSVNTSSVENVGRSNQNTGSNVATLGISNGTSTTNSSTANREESKPVETKPSEKPVSEKKDKKPENKKKETEKKDEPKKETSKPAESKKDESKSEEKSISSETSQNENKENTNTSESTGSIEKVDNAKDENTELVQKILLATLLGSSAIGVGVLGSSMFRKPKVK